MTVGLGTDGAVSSNTLDVLGAVRQAALVHKAGGDPTAVGALNRPYAWRPSRARRRWAWATGWSLEVGKRADLIVLDLSAPASAAPARRPGRRSRTRRALGGRPGHRRGRQGTDAEPDPHHLRRGHRASRTWKHLPTHREAAGPTHPYGRPGRHPNLLPNQQHAGIRSGHP